MTPEIILTGGMRRRSKHLKNGLNVLLINMRNLRCPVRIQIQSHSTWTDAWLWVRILQMLEVYRPRITHGRSGKILNLILNFRDWTVSRRNSFSSSHMPAFGVAKLPRRLPLARSIIIHIPLSQRELWCVRFCFFFFPLSILFVEPFVGSRRPSPSLPSVSVVNLSFHNIC